LFAIYALCSLVPVVVLGLVLAISIRTEAHRRGLAEGRSEATLVAQAAVEPLLQGRPLGAGLSGSERRSLEELVHRAVGERHVLRMRLRNLAGRVVFSDDNSGLTARADDEALDAARGNIVARLTRLNTDSNDTGSSGVESVEVYLPLNGGPPLRRVGVLEIYLPYAPISHDVSAGLHSLSVDLGVGLAVLYLVLFAITASVSRGLRRAADINAFLAEHDVLTELPNRTLFHRRAGAAIAAARESRGSAAIAIIDLDRFKDVNDTLGHHNGDGLLTQIAARLSSSMRLGDTIARLGGDEFGVVLPGVRDAEPILRRLRQSIDAEVDVAGLPLSVQASIGFVIAPDDGADVDELMQRADVAMYAAKARHAGVMRYDRAHDHYDATSLTLVSELRRAIVEGQLVLHYQPQATIDDGRVCAVEALVRWEHPVHGLLRPDRFMPLAEQTDVIDELTRWVLRAALDEVERLGAAGAALTVAVNVSARNLSRRSFSGEVIEALAGAGVSPDRLVIEVTETALMADPDHAKAVLTQLADHGARISIDDFGQGQTSLGYLSALPIRELKIDRGFVTDMDSNAGHAAIVQSIIDLGHNLGLTVVGEGVETNDVLSCLHSACCDVAQGFLLARPMPAQDLARWLKARSRTRTGPRRSRTRI
jgi:diguanylate cyclase (GGDEF)-like protein